MGGFLATAIGPEKTMDFSVTDSAARAAQISPKGGTVLRQKRTLRCDEIIPLGAIS